MDFYFAYLLLVIGTPPLALVCAWVVGWSGRYPDNAWMVSLQAVVRLLWVGAHALMAVLFLGVMQLVLLAFAEDFITLGWVVGFALGLPTVWTGILLLALRIARAASRRLVRGASAEGS